MDKKDRARELAVFAKEGPSALLACRALDEGLDLPEVDAAILVASTRSHRQRIQRIGRTLRRGHPDKESLILSLHVGQTTDEDICNNDQAIFGEVATIHTLTERTVQDFLATRLV